MPINKRIDEIDKEYLQSLVDEKVMEDKGLEYKRDLNILKVLPKGIPQEIKDKEKREFCADVSAFANADGGLLIYGIDQDVEGRANELTGISCLDNFDKLRTRLFQIIGAGIEPQLFGVDIEKVDLDKKRSIILIHVPSSWSKPHWVGKKGCRTFYTRTSSGKDHLDIRNVRELFVLSETAIDRIRKFRDNRVAEIIKNATPVHMASGPKLVLHVVPFSAVSSSQMFNLAEVEHDMHFFGISTGYNIEGLYGGTGKTKYCLVFRDGSVEIVREYAEGHVISPAWCVSTIKRESLPLALKCQTGLGVSPPSFVMPSLVNVQGCRLDLSEEEGRYYLGSEIEDFARNPPFSKQSLHFSDVRIDTFNPEMDEVLRSTSKIIWQAAGFPYPLKRC